MRTIEWADGATQRHGTDSLDATNESESHAAHANP